MGDQGLREALEEFCADESSRVVMRGEVGRLLAAHPAESVPRPVIDREVLETTHYQVGRRVYATDACGCGWFGEKFAAHLLDAVMKLAAPMPTREEIAETLREAFSTDSGRAVTWQEAADAVLALLNGTDQ